MKNGIMFPVTYMCDAALIKSTRSWAVDTQGYVDGCTRTIKGPLLSHNMHGWSSSQLSKSLKGSDEDAAEIIIVL